MSIERWLPIIGYEGHYEVSDHGRVRSLSAMGDVEWCWDLYLVITGGDVW